MSQKIHLDLLCNEFEYEILYKKAFNEGIDIGSDGLINQANRHKRGYSQGNYAGNGIAGTNASPASHLNVFGSPT